MTKNALLLLGLLILLVQHYVGTIHSDIQYSIFIIGILFLGVPHGAADLLVAAENADWKKTKFSKSHFFKIYLGRLLAFGCILYLFPVVGILLFIVFAAYHFGETDLHQFKINSLTGKFFVIAYGLVILGVMLLHHFDEVIPIFQVFESGRNNQAIINWISENRYYLLSANVITFFIATFIYFLKNKQLEEFGRGYFLIRIALILFILFNMPMLLGFTFYFVIWHSLLSLTNIISYLRRRNNLSFKTITKQVLLYSMLAIAGIGIFGVTFFILIDENAITGYIILGLAVLTAPHMEIMYDMYNAIRQRTKLGVNSICG